MEGQTKPQNRRAGPPLTATGIKNSLREETKRDQSNLATVIGPIVERLYALGVRKGVFPANPPEEQE